MKGRTSHFLITSGGNTAQERLRRLLFGSEKDIAEAWLRKRWGWAFRKFAKNDLPTGDQVRVKFEEYCKRAGLSPRGIERAKAALLDKIMETLDLILQGPKFSNKARRRARQLKEESKREK